MAIDKWPGPYTFVFPSRTTLPKLLTGAFGSIAIRMSSNIVASNLCKNMPITSTSANISGQPVVTNINEVEKIFGTQIDGVIDIKPGNLKPSQIIDILSNQQYR